MLYSKMGNCGERGVSRLGFGCMRLPEEGGKIDRKTAAAMIDRAYEEGVNYFDTAYGYHGGESEVFLSEALVAKRPRESYYLADKLPLWLMKEYGDVDRLFDEQLERTKAGYFDYYLLHAISGERWKMVKELKVCEQLQEKKKQGLIRNLGFSFHGDLETFRAALNEQEWDFVQIQINYLDDVKQDAGALYDMLCEKNIPCVAMEPVRGGFLANLPEKARAVQTAVNSETAASWAFRWCMDKENMPVILSGMSTMEQVEENLGLFSEHRPLSGAEKKAVEETREAILSIKTVPCTACGYCMDCSFGVDIPGVFHLYNEYKLFGNAFSTKEQYGAMGEKCAASCESCGACVPLCPQGIAIPERLAEIHAELSGLE